MGGSQGLPKIQSLSPAVLGTGDTEVTTQTLQPSPGGAGSPAGVGPGSPLEGPNPHQQMWVARERKAQNKCHTTRGGWEGRWQEPRQSQRP